ncbi:MAG: histidine phosphatase family protein [Actinobacteria bacterium]|nr:histidine phosphatase family protein [Actinomycetota bacterium]
MADEFELWLVRHGETEWSKTGRHTSRTDVPLTEPGERQAEALGGLLGGQKFARVLSSPKRRALDTCRLAGYGDSAEIADDLQEWDYGEYEAEKTVDIRRTRPDWSLWDDGAPGGETPAQVGERARRVLAEFERAGGDVVVFSHGHFLRVLTATWLGLPPESGRRFGLSTATLGRLGHEREHHVVWLWNQPAGE